MSGQIFLDGAILVTFLILALSFVVIVVRIVRGPSLPDRILALDLLVAVAIGYIAVFGISTGYSIYVDIAIALGLVGFLSTIALARFVLRRGEVALGDEPAEEKSDVPE